jgi:hypothetical protein
VSCVCICKASLLSERISLTQEARVSGHFSDRHWEKTDHPTLAKLQRSGSTKRYGLSNGSHLVRGITPHRMLMRASELPIAVLLVIVIAKSLSDAFKARRGASPPWPWPRRRGNS